MTNNFIKWWYLCRKLVYKYEKALKEDRSPKNKQLWGTLIRIESSIQFVWPDWNDLYNQMEKEHRNRIARKKRARKYIRHMFDTVKADFVFLTITYDAKGLETKERTRRQAVQSFLNEHCVDFFGNVDYGDKNGREHYHVVCATDEHLLDYSIPHAFIKVKRITSKSPSRLATYVNKLSAHANKIKVGKSFHKRVKHFKSIYEAQKCADWVDCDDLPF